MKILKAPIRASIQVELEYEELCGLLKMIGCTSVVSRQKEYSLTKEESEALSTLFRSLLSEYVPEEDR